MLNFEFTMQYYIWIYEDGFFHMCSCIQETVQNVQILQSGMFKLKSTMWHYALPPWLQKYRLTDKPGNLKLWNDNHHHIPLIKWLVICETVH